MSLLLCLNSPCPLPIQCDAIPPNVMPSLRKIGVVDQEPVLFAGSIADNIRYGVPSATDKQVEAAAKQVRVEISPPLWFCIIV